MSRIRATLANLARPSRATVELQAANARWDAAVARINATLAQVEAKRARRATS